jgi:hypothetical protein
MQPVELTCYPAGSAIESVTPDGKKGLALEKGEVDIWLPRIASMWNLLAPVHLTRRLRPCRT